MKEDIIKYDRVVVINDVVLIIWCMKGWLGVINFDVII